jgi:excisionase family DNA binding protein
MLMLMPTIINGESYLTSLEATERLQVSRQTLENLVKDGTLKKYRQGIRRTIYFKESEVESLLEIKEVDKE